jgi:stage II sporulation protein AA (anti-sigma F factor antagonist)
MLHQRLFAFELAAHGPYSIVRATGELDIAAIGELRDCVRRAARRAPNVVIDLRSVTFMDTFALRTLVGLQEESTASGEWSLHAVPGAGVQRLLDLAGARDELRWIAGEQLAG